MPAHRRARTAVAPVALALLLALTGCGAAEDAVNQATDGAKQQAADAGKNAATELIRNQLCALVKDGKVSDDDLKQMKQLVDSAKQAGVPKDVLDAANGVIATGATSSSDQLSQLREKCAAA